MNFDSDEEENVMKMEEDETEMEDEELEDQDESLLEPQVILQNESLCQLCQGPLSSHYMNQPCTEVPSSTHFLFEESQNSTSSPTKPRCVVCSAKNPNREHLANHFIQELIEDLEDETQCSKCQFNAPDCKALVLHEVSKHEGSNLDKVLEDASLVSSKRAEVEARGHRQSLGPLCPICDQQMHKSHGRDHVSWHFVEELREMISDSTKCPECSYSCDKIDVLTRHLALFHCKLDELLRDEQLVALKRAKVSAKPKKVSIGPKCPICDIKDPAREHVSRHFMNELMEFVQTLDDQLQCPECSYHGEKSQNLARHIALVHSKLDVFLADEKLVEKRRAEYLAKPNKINIGSECPVCDQQLTKQHSRVHVIWHFMEELREIVQTFADPTKCDFCTYMNVSSDKVVKHIALGHSKLDEMLQDEELVQKKRALQSSKPKRENIGPSCPICDVRDPPREHVARHFSDELNELVNNLSDQLSCSECSYKGEKSKNLGLHIALVHGKLDEFIKNKALVKSKRQHFLSQPKKFNIGPTCPICDLTFTKSQNRDHVAWHFIDELRDFVQAFDDPTKCWKCDYKSEKMDNLVKHVALGHSKLDEYLQNEKLVKQKRSKALAKPKRVAIGAFCPICDVKDPAREHVARHFSEELLCIINTYPDNTQCMECEYKGDKPKTLSIHVGLVHAKLDVMLQDADLVQSKRASYHAKPKKLSIGPVCPVCDLKFTKTQNRDHVSWHYIDELRAIVQEFDDPNQCPQCPYSADTNEKMVKHVALGHSMLDALLQDENLLELKRLKALNKPKKVSLGTHCPICDNKEPSREHVARHFSEELNDIVMGFEDSTQCTQCSYNSDKAKNVAIHIALVHSILDHFLSDAELVKSKREQFSSKPQKINVGSSCPICDVEFAKGQNRDHVCWHFMDELRDIVLSFPDTTLCNECHYSSDKLDNLVKHVALGHSKLDELLSNENLVAEKREQALNKPKKIAIGPNCPICNMKFTKAQNRDHVSWHFIDELREFVNSTGSEKKCIQCYYTTDKMDNLVKHYALGHCKLDELLLDEKLVQRKKEEHAKKPKRISFGPDCPICHEPGKDRDHVSRHFMPELLEIVNEMPNRKQCNLCSYKSNKREYMAKHIALFHCRLDELMANKDLVELKQKKAAAQPKRVPMGDNCVICGVGFPQREHVCRHFQDELLEITSTFESPLSCAMCQFTADRVEYVARHVGLVHRKLDEMICDEELVKRKQAEFQSQNQGNSAGNSVKIEPVRKSQRQLTRPTHKVAKVKIEPVSKAKTESVSKAKIEPLKAKIEPLKAKIEPVKAKIEPVKAKIEPVKANFEPLKATLEPVKTKIETVKAKIEPLKVKIEPVKANIEDFEPLDTEDFEEENEEFENMVEPEIEMNEIEPIFEAVEPVVEVKTDPETESDEEPVPKKAKVQHPKVTIERASKATKESAKKSSVSLLKASLLKDNKKKIAKMPPLSSLLKPQISPSKTILNSLLKPLPTVKISKKEKPKMPILPASISLTPKLKVASLLQAQKPILDTASIADINNSWAESLMSNGCKKSPQKRPAETQKVIGSCTLTPATGKKPKVSISKEPSVSLQRVQNSKGTLIAPSVTLMPADPKNKPQKIKFQITPTATITPVNKKSQDLDLTGIGNVTLKPLFPSKPLEKTNFSKDFGNLGKPLAEQMICTPEILDEDSEEIDDEEENMVLEPQILFNDEDMEDLDADQADLFCDLCGMELEHHPDNQPCPPEDGFLPEFENCPVCEKVQPTKEHVARHFLADLKQMVENFDDPMACNKCDYQSEKNMDIVALHIALNHDALKNFLPKKSESKKVQIGNLCPICDFKEPTREHVSRHFMNELLDHVATLSDHQRCQLCTYQGEKPQNLAKHIALVHNMLDDLLTDDDLVQKKRIEAISRPKKISIGSTCPVCLQSIQKRDSRVHVIWHFMEELREMVQEFSDTTVCNFCPYSNPNPDKMAKHMALGHSKLDELLSNQELVAIKQKKALAKPKKLSIGPECPICDIQFTKSQNRDHVSWHFMDELREYVQTFEDTQQCNQCDYKSDKLDNLVKHLALGHSKLDELLLNEELVAAKRELVKAKPKKVSIGPTCPICDLTFTKSQNRDHVSWHFMEELRAIVNDFDDPQVCNQCDYTTDKVDNLVKHLALGHSKLDEFLMDENLVASKREQYQLTRK